MYKKYTFGTLTALAVVGLTVAMPAAAQDAGAGASGEQGDTRTATSNQQPERGTDWGWLGLLGLAGLAGLRRPAPTVVHQDKDGAARAY